MGVDVASPLRSSAAAPAIAGSRRSLRSWLWPDSGAINPIPALDGLRAVAVLLVMAFHAWYNAPGMDPGLESVARQSPIWYGQTGVQLFFVLSGFLLFLPYASWILGRGKRPSALKFYRRRALRVGPAFWAAVLILAAAAPWTVATAAYAVLHLLFVFNFVPNASGRFDSVFWTMAIEVQFYAAMPLIAVIAKRAAERFGVSRAVGLLLAACVVVSALSHTVEHRYGPLGPITWGLFGRYSLSESLAVFAFGITASMLFTYWRAAPRARLAEVPVARLAIAAFAAGVVGALALALGLGNVRLISGEVGLLYGGAYSLALLGLLLGPAVLRKPFEARAVRFIGLISYSLYIWHTVVYRPISAHLASLPVGPTRMAVGMALMLAAAVPVAYVSFLVFERPFTSLRRRSHDAPAAGEAAAEPQSPDSAPGSVSFLPPVTAAAAAGE
jgi:peptidoglycan/LPS O-acetylase OafA/YrhL